MSENKEEHQSLSSDLKYNFYNRDQSTESQLNDICLIESKPPISNFESSIASDNTKILTSKQSSSKIESHNSKNIQNISSLTQNKRMEYEGNTYN